MVSMRMSSWTTLQALAISLRMKGWPSLRSNSNISLRKLWVNLLASCLMSKQLLADSWDACGRRILCIPPSKSTASLSPLSADKEAPSTTSVFSRGKFLRRTPSKQSLHMNNENGSEDTTSSGSASLTSTGPTELDGYDISRDSQTDVASFKSKPTSVIANQAGLSREHHDLHIQIEDLLLALSEAQREQAQLAAMLQREREERNDDHRAVGLLLDKLRRGGKKGARSSMPPPSRTNSQADEGSTPVSEKRRTLPPRPRPQVNGLLSPRPSSPPAEEDTSTLVEQVQERLDTNARFSASFETKAHLRSTLTRTREQLGVAEKGVRDLTRSCRGLLKPRS